MEKGRALHLNKLESSSPKDALLCQAWLKLAQRFWRRRFFKFVNVFSQFRNYLPLEKDFIWTKDALCFEISQLVLEKKRKMWKDYDSLLQQRRTQQQWTTFKFWSEMLTWFRWAKNAVAQTQSHIKNPINLILRWYWGQRSTSYRDHE